MTYLVGYTGFVGSNLYKYGKFDKVFNSKNISEAYGTSPELLIYAGLRAEKYLANNDPEKDMEQIYAAEENIKKIAPKNIVLISTVDVLKDPNGADENTKIDTDGLHAYGYNRYQLELFVREMYPDALIVRLPGLFGDNIKKNFIYDFINVIPFMLKKDKFDELSQKDCTLGEYYTPMPNGFYKLNDNIADSESLKQNFKRLGFTALNFTDSRSRYQFYPLKYLWKDINTALDNGIKLLHPATEPVCAGELYKYLTGSDFVNELGGTPADYDFKTVYDKVYGGSNGYIYSKKQILDEIKSFVEGRC